MESENANHLPVIRKAKFRFYKELNDHLPENRKNSSFDYSFKGMPTVKTTIQAIGIPHGEVDFILINGKSVDFDYQLHGGEEVQVYPQFESFGISPAIRLKSEPLSETRFVIDVNLGKLAQKLRLLGFDTLFRNDFEDDEIIEISEKKNRIILTRDKGILKHNSVRHGYWVRNDDPKKQLNEVIDRFQLRDKFKPFSRCSNCNNTLKVVSKSSLESVLPEDVLSFNNEFWQCRGCGKIYWEGSHFSKIVNWLNELKNS